MALNFSTFEELRMHNFIQVDTSYIALFSITYFQVLWMDGACLLVLAEFQGQKLIFHFKSFRPLLKFWEIKIAENNLLLSEFRT
jgi:hypothetical protein